MYNNSPSLTLISTFPSHHGTNTNNTNIDDHLNFDKIEKHNNTTNIGGDDAALRLKSFCFPDNFSSTSSSPSVNTYLKKIYGEGSVSSYGSNNQYSNNNNINNISNSYQSHYRNSSTRNHSLRNQSLRNHSIVNRPRSKTTSTSQNHYSKSNSNNNYNNTNNRFNIETTPDLFLRLTSSEDYDNISSTNTTPSDLQERSELLNHLNKYSFGGNQDNINPLETTENNKDDSLLSPDIIPKSNLQNIKETDIPVCPRTPSPINNNKVVDQVKNNNNEVSNKLKISKYDEDFEKLSFSPGDFSNTNINNTYPKRRFSHRKSNAISLSKAFEGLDLTPVKNNTNEFNLDAQTIDHRQHNPMLFENFKDFKDYDDVDDAESPLSPLSFAHHTSPVKTINDTFEQIRRNKNGRFGSLSEFAEKNHINTNGKLFVRPESPKINLDMI